jgi:hypothetical protein
MCLPTGYEKLRLVLVPLVLVAGIWAGVEFSSAFANTAEAITVGVLTTDMALHIGELVIHALASSRWAWAFAVELMAGLACGSVFFVVFGKTGEAIAMGLMTANITLHVVELIADVVFPMREAKRRGGGGIVGPRRHPVRRLLGDIRRWFGGGFGGPTVAAGAC